MVTKSVIFISAVSKELKSARQLVANTLTFLGYEPDWQEIFGSEQGDLRSMLRRRIDASQGVLQIVGQRYGAEPADPDPQFGRVSYTQYEALYARQRGKKVWILFLDEKFPVDPCEPEPDAPALLQQQYRQQTKAGDHLYHPLTSVEGLESGVLRLRDELTHLRRRGKQWATLIVALLAVSLGLGVWMVIKQNLSQSGIEEVKTAVSDLKQYVADPINLRRKMEEKIEQSFREKRAALLAANAAYTEVNELSRWHDSARGQVEEAVAFIVARAGDSKSTTVQHAALILEEHGVDAALEFLGATLKAARLHRKEEGRQLAEASMMKASLHQSRFESAEEESAIRDAITDAPDWWLPRNALGFILDRRAEWHAAEAEFEAARMIMGSEGESTVLNNIATLYQATNRLAEAEPLLERALKIDEKRFGPEHPDVARDLNNLAQSYKATNRLAATEPLILRALKIYEKSLGPEDPRVAIVLSNLATLYFATNRSGEAEPLMDRALKINEKSLGPEHPTIATDLNNLATLYQETNRVAEAKPLLERALKISEKSFGPEHPYVARVLNNLAGLYQASRRLPEAEPLILRALKINEQSYGAEHPAVGISLAWLAQIYQETQRLSEAEPLMRRDIVILMKFTQKSGHRHPNLKAAIDNYKILLRRMAVPDAQFPQRLAAIGQEAACTPAETAALLAQMFGPFDVAVTQVLPDGQGPALGIRTGDIVRRYNGIEINKVDDLVKLTGEVKGDALPLETQRGEETLRLTVKPGRLGLMLEDRPKPKAK